MQFLKHDRLEKIFLYIALFFASVILLFTIFFLTVYLGAFGKLPGKDELSAINNEEASLVYSSDSVLIGEYFAENRTNIHWKDIPDHLKNEGLQPYLVRDWFFYESDGPVLNGNYKVDITGVADLKWQAACQHASQIGQGNMKYKGPEMSPEDKELLKSEIAKDAD